MRPWGWIVLFIVLLATASLADDGTLRADATRRFHDGDVAGARDLLLQITAKPDTSHAHATALFDLGACNLRLGELGPARQAFARAVSAFETRGNDSHDGLALALEGLAAALTAQENTADARTHLDRARSLRASLSSMDHPQMARLDALAARLAVLDNDLDTAVSAGERAKESYRRVHGNVHPRVAAMVRNFADLYLEQGNVLDADLMTQQADFITREVYGPRAPERAATLAAVGRTSWQLERHDKAVASYREALSILDEHQGTAMLEVAACAQGLGRSLLARGDVDDARRALTRAADAYEHAWWRAGGTSSRATFMSSPYPLLAAAELAADHPEPAWQTLQRHHGRTLRHARWLRALSAGEQARRDSLLQRDVTLVSRIEQLAGNGETAAIPRLRAERTAIAADLMSLDETLRKRVQPDDAPLPQNLDDDEAVVGWLTADITPDGPRCWAWLVTGQTGLRWRDLPGPDTADSVATALRTALASPGQDTAAAASRLFEIRLAPLLPDLATVTRLTVVPDAALAGVPLAALRDPAGHPLHERFAITVSPSLGPAESVNQEAAPRGDRLLAVADPPFRAAHLAAMRSADTAPSEPVSRGVMTDVLRGRGQALDSLSRLPASRREVTDLAALFPDVDLLLGADASEALLRSRQSSGLLSDYDVIHLATHALVDAQRPERSALVLSQVDHHTTDDASLDGLLTAAEITAGWHLDADLVTLSACETGLGRPAPGEGYLGFTQAFLAAGAHNVLVSLWQVDDRATSLLMNRFYDNWRRRGLSKPAALAEAQQWLRSYEVHGRRVFDDPRDWAAFVLVSSSPR